MELEWEDDAKLPGNEKYPAMLAAIKDSSLVGDHRSWAVLNKMTNEGSARDLASRLARENPEFDVVSRKQDDGTTTVFARLKAEVDA